MNAEPMSHDEWVDAAVQAAVDQGYGPVVTDEAALDFIADILATAPTTPRRPDAQPDSP
jgi:hypothetical protein